MKIYIPFRDDMKKEILEDRKIQTARYKRYGLQFDYFEIEGRKFEFIRSGSISKLKGDKECN